MPLRHRPPQRFGLIDVADERQRRKRGVLRDPVSHGTGSADSEILGNALGLLTIPPLMLSFLLQMSFDRDPGRQHQSLAERKGAETAFSMFVVVAVVRGHMVLRRLSLEALRASGILQPHRQL